MALIICIFLYIAIFLFDFIPVLKNKKAKTIWVYGTIFVSTFIIIFLCEINIDVPSPSEPIKYFFTDILKLK